MYRKILNSIDEYFKNINRKQKVVILLSNDIIAILIAYYISFILVYPSNSYILAENWLGFKVIICIFVYLIFLWGFKMYKSIFSNAGFYEVLNGLIAILFGSSVNLIITKLFYNISLIRVSILAFILISVFTIGIRMSISVIENIVKYSKYNKKEGLYNTLIVGAGCCASAIIDEIKREKSDIYNIVGIIDDDINKKNTFLNGIKVIGNRDDIVKISNERDISKILFAISKIDNLEKGKIIDKCNLTKASVKVIPGYYEIIDKDISIKYMRDIEMRDLIGREEVILDKQGINEYIEDKVVLVTGAGGSIGSELCRQIAKFKPKLLLMLDIYENNLYDLQNDFNYSESELNKKVIIASVRDSYRINQIMSSYKPNIVFHAAAHKHVPLMEDNPTEAIKNNVLGTLNIAQLSSQHRVKKFVLISTDKAVNPTNVMGATKRLCEMIVQALNSDIDNKTEFVAVRFGNVLGSNGSVIPLFKKQIERGGPITLTHKEITRYFMLIPEAAQLVLQAGAYANGGEVFVLDMGSPIKIYDLAENLIRLSGYEPHKDIEIEIIGLRPGEKLYEELLINKKFLTKTAHNKIFIDKTESLSINKILNQIEELKFAIKIGNVQIIIDKLKEIVPTYYSPEIYNNRVIN